VSTLRRIMAASVRSVRRPENRHATLDFRRSDPYSPRSLRPYFASSSGTHSSCTK
jgi:hypothetical protein